MNVLVTGGAGFIGSHTVDQLLSSDHNVTVIDNLSTGRIENLSHVQNEVRFIEADIGETGNWSEAFENIDWCIHLAALADIVPSIQNPQDYFHSIVIGTFNVLEAAKSSSVKRFIYSASSSCYGLPDIHPTPEDSKIDPQYPYALTKRIGEEMVLHYCKIYKLAALSLRFFNVYGTRSRTSGTYGAVFGVFLAQKLANEPLTVVGDGMQTRDFTYVTDVAEAIIKGASSSLAGEIFNVGSEKTVSINQLASLIGGRTTNIPKRPGEPDCTFADISRIKSRLNWSPKTSIQEGVKKYWKKLTIGKKLRYGRRLKLLPLQKIGLSI